MRSDLIVKAVAVSYNDEYTKVFVDFFLGESKYSVAISVEDRLCLDIFEIDTGDDVVELSTSDVLNHIIDCDLLADDLIADLESGRIVEYYV